jgi:hypothetical protein
VGLLFISRSLDRLLGPGAVTAGPDNSLRLDDAALSAQLHRRSVRNGVRCWCPACRAARQAAADALNAPPAPAPAGQPWEPRPAKAST